MRNSRNLCNWGFFLGGCFGAVSLFFGDVRFLHHVRCHAGGFRVCGRDEGATKTDECLRSPPRPLRVHTPVTWILSEVFILVALLPFNYAEVTNPATDRRSFPQEIAVAGGVQRGLKSPRFTFSAPSGRSFVTFFRARKEQPPLRRCDGSSEKNQDRKSKPTMPKSRENQQGGNPFCTHPIATAPPVCYNNQAPKGAKEGVFNAEQ